jgi:hypothetical protein
MAVTRFEVVSSEPLGNGELFGDAGTYTRIDGIAHYAVDPENLANVDITDLALCERDADGRVLFNGDVTLLVPDNPAKASGPLLVEVPNRGNRIAMRLLNNAPADLVPSADVNAGDGHLMRRGWCVAFVGWQWDVPDCVERLGLRAPHVPPERLGAPSRMNLRIQPAQPTSRYALTDHHVGNVGKHAPIAPDPASLETAQLMVRETHYGEAKTLPQESWRFISEDDQGSDFVELDGIELDGGFQPGLVYDILYTPAQCPVAGVGLLAVREFASFARDSKDSPFGDSVTHLIGEGMSQCGRFLRTMLHLGLNVDEQGNQVFDGILAHIAGGRRGEFNQRYGQPSVQPTPAFGHLFPFADHPQTDPQTGNRAGLLDNLSAQNKLPRIMYTDTSSEYWRGDAGLSHINLDTGDDVELPQGVKRYLFAGTEHNPGQLPYARLSVFGSSAANRFNTIDYRPLYRAALENLRSWVMEDVEPPASVYPRSADGTAATREQVLQSLATSDLLTLPLAPVLPGVRPLDLGSRASEGVGAFPAQSTGPAYATVVSAVDVDGNETGGVAMPDVTVPVGVHTGFNPRAAGTGGDGQLLEYVGSSAPFLDVGARYAGANQYLLQVREAAITLVSNRYLLEEDIDECVDLAKVRYEAALAGGE